MFNTPGIDVPFRDRNRFHCRRNVARRPAGFGLYPVSDMWTSIPDNRIPRDYFDDFVPSCRFQEFANSPLPHLRSPAELAHSNSHSNGFNPGSEFSVREQRSSPVMSFDRAATALSNTLDATIKFCREVEKQFNHETSSIAAWADPSCIDSLWRARLEWNGVPAIEFARNPEVRPPPTVITYDMVVKSLHRAVDELQMSDPSRITTIRDLECSQQSPERVRTTLKKLYVTLQGIEELMESVRRCRVRIAALHKELASAYSLLGDIRALWTPCATADSNQRSGG